MASTYSFNSNSCASRYLEVNLSQTKNETARTSTISGTITVRGTYYDGSTWIATGATTITIGGQQMYYLARQSAGSHPITIQYGRNGSAIISLNNITVAHNDLGAASVSCSIKTAIFTSTITEKTGSTWVLDPISPKITTPTVSTPSISGVAETYIGAAFAITSNGGGTISSNSTFLELFENSTTSTVLQSISGTLGTFSNLKAGTTYYIRARTSNNASSPYSSTGYSGRVAVTTVAYPSITKVGVSVLYPGYTQTISLYNPLGRSVTVQMIDTSTGSVVNSVATTNASWSFSLSATTIANFLGSKNSSSSVKYVLTYGSTVSSSTGHSYGLILSNSIPTWSSSTTILYRDSNSTITNITNNNQIIVQGYSTLVAYLQNAGATGLYGASIADYEISIGNTLNYKSVGVSGTGTVSYGTAPKQSSIVIYARAKDSRGLYSTAKTLTVSLTEYKAPTCTITAKRDGGYSDKIIVATNVNWSLGSGNTGTIKYYYQMTGGNKTATDNLENETYNLEKTYALTMEVEDKLEGKGSDTATLAIGKFPFFIDVEQEAVGVNCFPEGSGLWIDDIKQPVIRTGKTAPSSTLGNEGDLYIWI